MFNIYEDTDTAYYASLNKKKGLASLFFSSVNLLIVITLLTIIIGMGVYTYVSFFSYIDLPTQCYIKINKDVNSGNRDTIIKALHNLKVDNPTVYQDTCQYVKTISETDCVIADSKTSSISITTDKGCYLKGSKVIFIKASRFDTENVIKDREDTIAKYAEESRSFWLQKDEY
jgi:hypothetical protein